MIRSGNIKVASYLYQTGIIFASKLHHYRLCRQDSKIPEAMYDIYIIHGFWNLFIKYSLAFLFFFVLILIQVIVFHIPDSF